MMIDILLLVTKPTLPVNNFSYSFSNLSSLASCLSRSLNLSFLVVLVLSLIKLLIKLVLLISIDFDIRLNLWIKNYIWSLLGKGASPAVISDKWATSERALHMNPPPPSPRKASKGPVSPVPVRRNPTPPSDRLVCWSYSAP